MLSVFRLSAAFVWAVACVAVAPLGAQDRYAVDWQEVWNGGEDISLQSTAFERSETPVSDGMADWYVESVYAWARPKRQAPDTMPRPKNKLTAKEWRKTLTFAERNSGAFRSRKHGGVRSPGMAALCSAVVPGLGQCYNAQWYKPPVIYAGAVVIGYFIDFNWREKRICEREIDKRFYNAAESIRNPDLAGTTYEELLRLRNYYEQNFELTLIIAGAVYLLNIIDAVVYAHLFDFNVSSNLSMRLEPYAVPNFDRRLRQSPLDMGFRLCMNF
ncbi:MAG: hypothetical protein K2O01_03820 [Bacteroidales bacterium]|nr:hypothetical protein [Bacteroidales bacterium]